MVNSIVRNNYGNDGKVNVATTVYEHKLHELLTTGNGYIPTLTSMPVLSPNV